MIEAIAITIGAIAVGLYIMCISAPVGYQDERGWHPGEPGDK